MQDAESIHSVPPPHCGHGLPLVLSGKHKARCPVCNSFWDLNAISAEGRYDRTYPEMRSHYDPAVGRLKTRTLDRWLKINRIPIENLTVCEVGFGGGFCLAHLQREARKTYGIEAIWENLEHARSLGIPQESLHHTDALPQVLPDKIDFWIFLDSFEHLAEPETFVHWMTRNCSVRSRILLVAPEADSMSEKAMGRAWPHLLPDHPFHWSRGGFRDFFSRHGFEVERIFFPGKFVSTRMIGLHLELRGKGTGKFERWMKRLAPSGWTLFLNVGEIGLLLRRNHP